MDQRGVNWIKTRNTVIPLSDFAEDEGGLI